jgi:eukaryotic-like serine/threonine-protein kinase
MNRLCSECHAASPVRGRRAGTVAVDLPSSQPQFAALMPSEETGLPAVALSSRYAIERELGRGGMATVYLAHDLKHQRQVAVKVLRPELAAAIGPDRFLREIEIAARLNHPNILPLYDSGDAGSFLFYVMPYIRGESLRARLDREKPMPIGEAVAITRQVAAALEFAHGHGVVHRDVKPENILLHEGVAVVADFGIALALHSVSGGRLTGAGIMLGTPLYMSPEQSLGEPLDARSDVYSLACVLYEMLVGQAPHAGPNVQAVITRRLSSPALPLRRLRSAVPLAIERAAMKALATNPADRFASAAVFADALVETGSPHPSIPSVAVLPFRNLSADPENEYFADGITEDVIAQLSRIRALKVISRTSVMQFKKRDQTLREIGAALDATTLLEGSVRRSANRVRIGAQLIDVDADETLWAETYDRQLTDIFAIQSDVALQIAGALRAELSRDERVRIGREPTRDVDAYQLYLQGRHLHIQYTAEAMHQAIEYFERAIEKDPSYAMAWVGVAIASTELAETGAVRPDDAYRRARSALDQALELDSDLGEAHCGLAHVMFLSEFDWDGAELEFKRALELTPNSADSYDLYGRLCSALERYDEAIVLQTRAQELDPLAHRVDVATAYLRASRYDEALQFALRAVEFDPRYSRAHATVAWCLALMGRLDEALVRMRTAVSMSPGDTLWLGQLGQLLGMAGRMDEAHAILRQLQDWSRERYVSPYHLAYVYTGLGDRDNAVACLQRASEARAGAVYGIKGSFLFTTLRSHPGFQALLRQMNLD